MNLLKTKIGRLTAFGGLYLSEGLPQGLSGFALTLEFKRRGMDAAAISAFGAMIVLPWAWKFLMGPLVDNLHIRRFGARKQWIVISQIGMLLGLCLAFMNMPTITAGGVKGIGLFTSLMVLHNVFAATQDVAIDALACNVLREDERGLGNGIMFAGAQAGYMIGGSGVIWLKGLTGSLEWSMLLVPLILSGILTGVITLICEKSAAREMAEGELPAPNTGDHGWRSVKDQLLDYLFTVGRAVFLNRNGLLGLALALIPCGGLALSLLLATLIAPCLGMTDGEVAQLAVVSTLVWLPPCLLGGWLSDIFGRRLTLSVFSTLLVLPGLWIGWKFKQAGWDHPPESVNGVWPREEALIHLWWIASLSYSVLSGFTYSISSALYMDIVNPKIAGTHFTAMMAMTNMVTAYTLYWQGKALSTKEWGWSMWQIFLFDTVFGLLFLAIIPFLKTKKIKLDLSAQ